MVKEKEIFEKLIQTVIVESGYVMETRLVRHALTIVGLAKTDLFVEIG